MEHQQQHLGDTQIEQCANTTPGACPADLELHLAECEACLQRLLKWQHTQFKSFAMAGMNEERHPECPDESKIIEIAAGMTGPDTADPILEHAAQCDHCGPLLNHYLKLFSEEASPEIEALIDQLPSSRPKWDKEKAREIVVEMHRPLAPKFKRWWEIVLQPRVLATAAAGLVALASPIFIWGPRLMDAWRLEEEQGLMATVYAKNRTTEMRPVMGDYGHQVPLGSTMGTNDKADDFGHPELNKAWSRVDDVISSGGRMSPKWFQIEGELLLLKDPAKNAKAAEDAFIEAKSKGLSDDPSLEIDLATSYFEQFNHNPPKPDSSLPFQSIELLKQALESPKAKKEHKEAALFNLAIVYEKLEMWKDAKATWDKYLEMDPTGPWADEARSRREEDEKNMQKSGGRISFEPDFYVKHRSEQAVQDNTEEYLDKAAVLWLIDGTEQPDGISAQAITALADELETRSDLLLHDLIITIRSNYRRAPDMPALLALGRALQANREDDVPEALENARKAAGLFAESHNVSGELWARFAEVYAYQRGQSGTACVAAATGLLERLRGKAYPWLEGQLFLERAMCRNFTSSADRNTNIEQDLKKSEDIAGIRFPILRLRTLAASPGIERQQSATCETNTWERGLSGMKEYWKGVYPQERLYEFYSVLGQCAEPDYPRTAKAFLESAIAIRLSMDEKDRDWNMLVALYGHLATILTKLGQETTIPVPSDPTKPFGAITSIFLSESQLKMGKAEVALATLESARGPIEQIDNDLVMVEFQRVSGTVHLRLGQLSLAEQECQKGIEIAEEYLSTLKTPAQRVEWAIKTEELYRVLAQTWLQQKKIEDAWKVWEWAKARPISAYGAPFRHAAVTWPELQQAILALPVPSGPQIRLVYAVFSDRIHVWTVGRGTVQSRWIEINQEELNRKVDNFVHNCADRFSSIQKLQEQGRALFDLLLLPFEQEFSATKVLALEMDQQLWKLPVAAMRTNDNKYVVEKYDVTYSPGIRIESNLKSSRPLQPESVFLLINTYPHQPTHDLINNSSFNKPTILSGANTKNEVLVAVERSNQLFFFGHAVLQGNGVALMLNDNVLLDPTDFLPERMTNLSLVVLAACSTGTGGRSSGVDNTLVRTFLVAGVPHIVASQWDVYNVTTATLMRGFFQNSLAGQIPDLALANAQREFLQTPNKASHEVRGYQHPYYWAGFVVIGRADSVETFSTSVASR